MYTYVSDVCTEVKKKKIRKEGGINTKNPLQKKGNHLLRGMNMHTYVFLYVRMFYVCI
jgi:hypothetical protein